MLKVILGAVIVGVGLTLLFVDKSVEHVNPNRGGASGAAPVLANIDETKEYSNIERIEFGVAVTDLKLVEKVRRLAHKKLVEEGGQEKSKAQLDQMFEALVESGDKAPFEIPYEKLDGISTVALPAKGLLWTLSTEGMEDARLILSRHLDWLKNQSATLDAATLAGLRAEIRRSPLRLPPEAIAVGLTGQRWNTLVEEVPALNVNLGAIREDIILANATAETEIWTILTRVYHASLEVGVDISESPLGLRRALAPYYPPLEALILEIDEHPRQYLNRIAGELVASGFEIEMP